MLIGAALMSWQEALAELVPFYPRIRSAANGPCRWYLNDGTDEYLSPAFRHGDTVMCDDVWRLVARAVSQ